MDSDKSNKSDLINILEKRGFVHQITEKNTLDELLAKSQISIYSGFDATGSSLHVGHLLPIMILVMIFQQNICQVNLAKLFAGKSNSF